MSGGAARPGNGRPSRVPLPLLIPVGGFLVIGLAAVGFSRVLLSLAPLAATGTALTVAFGIMLVAALAARVERVRTGTLLSYVGAVVGIAMVAGGIALAAMGRGGGHGEEPGRGEEPVGGGAVVALAAAPGASADGFAETEITAPAGEPFTIQFDNRDAGIPHNVALFEQEDFSGEAVAATTPETGPVTQALEVPALEPGTYHFRCDVHPATMTGTLEVRREAPPAGEGPGEGGGPAGGAQVHVSAPPGAAGSGFAQTELTAPAGRPFTIGFANEDPATPHNVAVYREEDFSGEAVAATAIEPGPTTQALEVPALEPGTYYFRCDAHPATMTGTIQVS